MHTKKSILGVVFVICSLYSNAQKSFDEVFDGIRTEVFDGDRSLGKSQLELFVKKYPKSIDARLFLSRVYAWEKQYGKARKHLNIGYEQDSSNFRILFTRAEIEYWDDKYDTSRIFIEKALLIKPIDSKAIVLKTKVLEKQDSAWKALNFISKNKLENDSLTQLTHSNLRLKLQRDKIYIRHVFDKFSDVFDKWQLYFVEYSHRTKVGAIITRMNIARRFNNYGVQGEIDAYPKLNKNKYLYMNYGFSSSSIFPNHRFGLELNTKLPKSMTGSIGLRYLKFANSNVDIYTASLGKYVGDYWINVRGFYVPKEGKTFGSLNFVGRKYYSSAMHYVGIDGGYGNNPDDRLLITNDPSLFRLRRYRFHLEYQCPVSKRVLVNARVGYYNQETNFSQQLFIHRYHAALGFRFIL